MHVEHIELTHIGLFSLEMKHIVVHKFKPTFYFFRHNQT